MKNHIKQNQISIDYTYSKFYIMAICHLDLDIRYFFLISPQESQNRMDDSTLRGHPIVSVLTYRYNDIWISLT